MAADEPPRSDATAAGRSSGRLRWLAATAMIVALALLATPLSLSEPDTLSRLAIGRVVVERGPRAARADPRGFGPGATLRWSDPQWLGDALLYGAYRAGGARAVAALGAAIIALGLALLLLAARARGADAPLALALLVVVLPALAGRLSARNEMHLYWLAGATLWLLSRATGGARWPLWACAVVAALWANLHSSFVIGALLVLVAALDSERPLRRRLLLLAALHPLLWMLSPYGPAVYLQLWRHVVGAAALRALLVEWQPAWHAPAVLAALAVLVAAGVLSARRRAWGAALLTALVVVAAVASRRLAVLALLAAAVLAAPLSRALSARRVQLLCLVGALAGTIPLLAVGRSAARPSLEQQRAAPPDALLAALARSSARAFVPYNSAPWFLWRCPRVALFADPRNARGVAPLLAYRGVLSDPARIDRTATDLVVADTGLSTWAPLVAHLRRSTRWREAARVGRSEGRWRVFRVIRSRGK